MTMRVLLTSLLLLALVWLATTEEALACGVERWSVKVLSDGVAIDFQPTSTTVEDLRARTAPSVLGARSAFEQHVYEVPATLMVYHHEKDGDFHLVIAAPDDSSATMIAEIPDPACAPTKTLAKIWQKLRASLTTVYGNPTRWVSVNQPIQIAGVGFFDFQHGQRGVAPNAVELHPVIALAFSQTKPLRVPHLSISGATGSISQLELHGGRPTHY